MNPYIELKKMFSPGTQTFVGEITSIIDGLLYLKSPKGLVRLPKGNLEVSVGDNVLVEKGALVGKVKPTPQVKTYFV
jgi:hypothetical protein